MLSGYPVFDAHPVHIASTAHATRRRHARTVGARAVNPGICPASFSTVTLRTDSFNSGNTDIGGSIGHGYQWYPWHWFSPASPPPDKPTNQANPLAWFSGASPKDRLEFGSDGSIAAVGANGPNGQLWSAAQIRQAPYFVGKAFGGGVCVEAQISFDPTALDTTRGWPSFWAMALEHLSQGGGGAIAPGHPKTYERFIELDFMEVYKRPFPEYLGSAIDWFGQYKRSCPTDGFCRVAQSFHNTPGAIPVTTDWTRWHRVGAVWSPADQTHQGSIQYFFDGKPLAPPFVWKRQDDNADDPKPGSDNLFSVLDRQHIVLAFGSAATPIRVRSVIVHQPDDTHNLSN